MIMNHNINKLDLTITILFFFFLLSDKTFSIKRNSFWQYINNYNVICCACIILTSCSQEKALLAGYVCPSYEFQKWSFRIPMEEQAMSLLVFHHCICDFPCSCHSFNPNSCICHHFICLTDCMSLFRGHVTCWNSTLTGP